MDQPTIKLWTFLYAWYILLQIEIWWEILGQLINICKLRFSICFTHRILQYKWFTFNNSKNISKHKYFQWDVVKEHAVNDKNTA